MIKGNYVKKPAAKPRRRGQLRVIMPHLSSTIIEYNRRLARYRRDKVAKIQPKGGAIVKIALGSKPTHYRNSWFNGWYDPKRVDHGYFKAGFVLYPSDFATPFKTNDCSSNICRSAESRYFQYHSFRSVRRINPSEYTMTIVGKASLRRFRVGARLKNSNSAASVVLPTTAKPRRIGFVDHRPAKGERHKSMNRLIIR